MCCNRVRRVIAYPSKVTHGTVTVIKDLNLTRERVMRKESFLSIVLALFGFACGGTDTQQATSEAEQSSGGEALEHNDELADEDYGSPEVENNTDNGTSEQTDTPEAKAEWAALVKRGRRQFARFCDTCHPGGQEDLGPSIIGKRFTVAKMRRQIRQGTGKMRPIPPKKLKEKDMPALIAYLSRLGAVRGVKHP